MKIIDLPDGTEAEFPDDMDDAAISAVLQRQFGGPKAQVQPEEVYGLPGGKDLAPPEQPMSAIPGVDAAMKATVGAGKSIGDTIVKAARFASMSPMSPFGLARTMAEKVLPTGSMEQQDEALKRVEGVLAPSNPTESTAKGLTDFATMLAPVPGLQGGGVARAALGAALPTAIKSGGDPLETATAGVFGAGMHGLGRAIAMPFASKARPIAAAEKIVVDPAANSVTPANIGIELPASANTSSAVVPQLEAFAGKMLGGQRVVDRAEAAVKTLEHISEQMSSGPDKFATGVKLNDAVVRAKDGLKATTKAAYSAIKGELPRINVRPDNYAKALQRIIDEMGQAGEEASPVANKARRFLDELQDVERVKAPGTMPGTYKYVDKSRGIKMHTAEELEQKRQAINSLVNWHDDDLVKSGANSRFMSLAAAIEDDIDAALPNALKPMRQAAKDAYINMQNRANSAWAIKIAKLAKESGGRWETIAGQLSKADPAFIRHMRDTIDDPEVMAALKATRLADIFTDIRKGELGVAKESLPQIIQKNRDQLRALLDPEEFQRLVDLGDTGAALVRSQRIARGSQTAFLSRMLAYGGLALAHPLAAIGAVLGESAIASFLASKTGQRWLTHGFPRLAKGFAGAGRVGAAGLTTELERQKEEEKLRKRLERQIAEPIGAH